MCSHVCVCSYECRHVYHATYVVCVCSHVCACVPVSADICIPCHVWCVYVHMYVFCECRHIVPCHMCGVCVFTCMCCVPVSAGTRVPRHMRGDQRTTSGVSPLLPLCLVIHVCQLASRLSPTTVPLGTVELQTDCGFQLLCGFLCLLYKRPSF